MPTKDIFKNILSGRSYTVVIGVIALATSYFSYASSHNNLQLTHRLEVFDGRIQAIEQYVDEESVVSGSNENSILVIETKLERIERDIQEIKGDLKILISQ